MSAQRSRLALPAALYLGALLISAFTIRRGGAEFDEGLVLQAAARIAAGELPYADFAWPYGPAHPYLLGWSFDAFGPSMMGWRVLRSLVDAGVAVAVYALARGGGAPRPWALAGWLIAACAMAQPTSATPFAPALLLALLAVASATAARLARGGVLVPALLTALTAAWRLDFGLYAGGAVAVAILLGGAPLRERVRSLADYAVAAAALGLLAYLPFLIAVGPADLYDSLVGASLRERDYWTLPFPLSYDGPSSLWPPSTLAENAKDALGFYAPLVAIAGLAVVVWGLIGARHRGSLPPRAAGLAVFGVGALLYLLSRTDEFHATPLIVVLAAALPAALAARRVGRGQTLAIGLVLALLLVYGVGNRLSALLRAPELAPIELSVADGAQAPPAEAAALAAMARTVRRRVSEGTPIYTLTRRSDLVRFNQPLVYLVTDRPNPTARDYAIQTSAERQRELVSELERSRPGAIVRWTDRISVVREPNLRGRPTGARLLDRWVADRYRLLQRFGDYDVLVPRTPR